ncbi:MAG: ATP-binding protein [Rubrobacteraceae bacterium]
MLSGKKRSPGKPRVRRSFLPGFKRGFRPRIGIRVWLTALFMLVTAFAGVAAYVIVQPILYQTINRASNVGFQQVGQQFQTLLQRNGGQVTPQQIKNFALNTNVQWGIVRAKDGVMLQGNLDNWSALTLQKAVKDKQPRQGRQPLQTGVRAGQQMSTYAVPVKVKSEMGQAIVFTRYYVENDVQNVKAAYNNIQNIALLAGALALLISGFSGYFAADAISRRVSRLGVAAEHLAAGNFEERIETHIEDEVGALGSTFNSMAASLKDAFRQVEQEKERGRAILDGMTDAVVGVDKNLNPIFVNPRARELLESSDVAFHNHLQEVLAKTLYNGPIEEPEINAGERIIEVRAAPLEEGALAILRDVTEERNVERAKAEFIANASHELKTPLTALSGYLEMMEDEDDEAVRTAFLEDMRLQTERLQSLARTLLDLSRLDANAVVFKREEVNLEDLLHDLRRDFGYTSRPMDIKAEEEVPPVETDPTQLHRMLAILLDNALKYSEKDAPISLDLHREDGHAIVSVADNGCGIPEAEIPHIFDRFYRAQGSSRADGTGLGLALAREITDHLGGEIKVESKQGTGSTFSVSLPLSSRPPALDEE